MIIYGKEKEILKAQKRSLAAWINNTLGATVVDADNLFNKLSTGVILCKLAKCIQKKVDEVNGYYGKVESLQQLKYWESAKRETFFARDNAEMFIRWCESFGVRDVVLFESDGLVLQTQPRTVVLCLLELSRLASKYGVLLPPPIQLSQVSTIALEDNSDCSGDEFFFATPVSPTKFQRWDSGCSSGPRTPSPTRAISRNSTNSKTSSTNSSLKRHSSNPVKKKNKKNVVMVVRSQSEDLLSGTIKFHDRSRSVRSQIPKLKSARSRSDNHLSWEILAPATKSTRISSPSSRRSLSSARSDTISSKLRSSPNLHRSCSSISSSSKSLTEKSCSRCCDETVPVSSQRRRSVLDRRVLEVARQYKKDESKIYRLSEGHYCFNGKNVHLRIVRGNNVVVRLGGGWDTLEHFVSKMDFNRVSSHYGHKKYENIKPIGSQRNVSTF
ncbi:hypothetical protein JTE90_017723 [Oedothorax gibbosus]|uniref:Growth arrest-specific protein 2 n=1 Tax=Oedothorax gibbosus TaxID=931172 RepID=A0AAV6UAL5_9ARAC|nr:hypothetical protein JTE90_017723 [Oedothorax gibbosus]